MLLSACGSSREVVQVVSGTDGTNGADGRDGENGANGSNGSNGQNGSNGTSCSVSSTSNGAMITCGNTSQVVSNGAVGATGPMGPQGQPGTNALANAIGIAAILKPCGDEFAHDEVLMKLTDGRVIAVYDGGPNSDRLAILVPNTTYITTDRSNNSQCSFRIDSSGNLTNQSLTNNGHN